MKKGFVLGLILIAVFITNVFAYKFWYKSPYDTQFKNVSKNESAILIGAMEASEPDMVYSAIKRVGELKLTNARQRVYEWLGQTNPESVNDATTWRNVFRISIWTLGYIGDEQSVLRLCAYWRRVRDKQAQVLIIEALGNQSDSTVALDKLNRLTKTIVDERIAYVLVNALLKHNSKTSMVPLMTMAADGRRVTGSSVGSSFSSRFKKYANSAAAKIAKKGKRESTK